MNRLILVFFFISGNLFAQNKPMFGISFSPFYTGSVYIPGDKQYYIPMDSEISRYGQVSFSGSLSYSFPASKSIDIETFLTYSQNRFRWLEDSDDTSPKGGHSQIELLLSSKFYLNRFLYFRLGIGPSFLLTEKYKYIYLSRDNPPIKVENSTLRYFSRYNDNPTLPIYIQKNMSYLDIEENSSNSLKHINRLNLAAGLGLGADFKLNNSLTFVLEPYVKVYCRPHYIKNFYEQSVYLSETKEQKYYNIRLHNYNIGLTTKLMFR